MNANLREAALPSAAAQLRVRGYVAADKERWNEFVRAHPEGTFFHLAEWQEVLRDAFGHRSRYLLAESDGRIRGVLPLALVSSALFGRALVSTPFCVYGGIVASDDEAQQLLSREAPRRLFLCLVY